MDGHLARYLFNKRCRSAGVFRFEEFCRIAADYYTSEDSTRRASYQALMEHLERLITEDELEILSDNEQEVTDEESLPDAAARDDDSDDPDFMLNSDAEDSDD